MGIGMCPIVPLCLACANENKQCKVQLYYNVVVRINLTSAPHPGKLNLIIIQYILVYLKYI